MGNTLIRLSPYLAGFFFITTIAFLSLAVYRGEVIGNVKDSVTEINQDTQPAQEVCVSYQHLVDLQSTVFPKQGK